MKHAEDQSVDSISAPKTAVSSHHQVHADVEKGSETAKEEIVITWQGDDDSSNPLNFPALKKARILFIVCTCCLCVLCSSSVISTCYTGIEKDLHASPEVAILSLSLFVLGLAIAPPFVAPLSEIGGRKVSVKIQGHTRRFGLLLSHIYFFLCPHSQYTVSHLHCSSFLAFQ